MLNLSSLESSIKHHFYCMSTSLDKTRSELVCEINQRVTDKVLERSNADLLIKLIDKAETVNEAISIAQLGTTYKRTGFHYDKRLEKTDSDIRYFKRNKDLSFHSEDGGPIHKLIIGDNYPALQNLLIQYEKKVDVIYIDPPYGKDKMGAFAQTNYDNSLTRDNLLSMLYPRLLLARQLLSPDGVIFCSIDDRNQSYVKCLFDEVFGESAFLFCVARITKKGGKTTQTIAKNNDYVLAYTLSRDIVFSQEEKEDLSKYKYSDQYEAERGKYALTQPLDYNSLQYGDSMDYPLVYQGKTYYPGGDFEKYKSRKNGNHGHYDWTWRWSESAVKWGIDNGMLELRGDRIYTKSYLKCRKKTGANEIEFIDSTKAYTTLSFVDNIYSNDNAKKELNKIFVNGNELFSNPKPTSLIKTLIKMVCSKENAVVLDFFAGSGTTGHAVLDLNQDGGKRVFLLCQINEITDTTPNGIVFDATAPRLKRIMTGEGYHGEKDFEWIQDNKPYGGNLDVYDLESVADFEATPNKTAFDVIDETLYGKEKFTALKDKISWVCSNFERTQKFLSSEE